MLGRGHIEILTPVPNDLKSKERLEASPRGGLEKEEMEGREGERKKNRLTFTSPPSHHPILSEVPGQPEALDRTPGMS